MKKIYLYRYILYLIVIVGVSGYLILLTYGYKINWETNKIQKTSVIYVASIPSDANVYINGEIVSEDTPIKYTDVFPGRYDVMVDQSGYERWEKTLNVEEDYVSGNSDIVLILEDKKEIELIDTEKTQLLDLFKNEDFMLEQSRNLYVKNNNELYFEDIFITRKSLDIENAVWFSDKKHIIYQVGNEIYFMDSDGANVKRLVILPTSKKALFFTEGDGKYLVYKQDDTIEKIQITNISSLFREKYLNNAVKIIR